MNDNEKILREIKIENYIWILYLVIIGIAFYANNREEKYFRYNDEKAKKDYQKLNIIIFSVALAVYLYFFVGTYQNVQNLKPSDSKEKRFFEQANLVGTSLILIAGVIFLFIAISDEDLATEIAFS